MAKSFEPVLPENYREVLSVDFSQKKLGLIMNLVAAALSAVVIVPAFFLIQPTYADYTASSSFLFVGVLIAYVIAHELTHGAAYKLLTHHKLTFGFTLTVAYCGVPDIYVYRRPAMIALLAPFVVFLPVFAVPLFFLTNTMDQLYCAIALGLHIGGCAGDLWDTWLYLTRFRDPATLMNDTGPKQAFYLPADKT